MGPLTVIPYYVLSGTYPGSKMELSSFDGTILFAPNGSTVYFENTITGK